MRLENGLALVLTLTLGLGAAAHAERWERLGPEGGMVVSLASGPEGEVLLGTADGHVFGSTDAGKNWGLRGRVGTRLDAVVTRIAIDPRNPKRAFAAVWYQEAGAGGGVFSSEDGGKSWRLAGLEGEAVRALELAPSNAQQLVAGTRTGVFLSADGGKSWARISPEGDEELKNLDSVEIDPRDPQVIYAGTYHLPWLTRDGGKTWKPVIAGIIDDSDIMSLRLDASNPDRVYMSACSGIYRSENQGGQWTKLQGIPYAARRTQVIVQDTANPQTLYAGTTAGLWVTRDAGENWTRTTSRDWVVNSLAVVAGQNGAPGRLVMGTEGQGVLTSDDAGTSFTEANHGFTHGIVRQLIQDREDTRHLAMILERGGAELWESRDEGESWTSMPLDVLERAKTATLNPHWIEEMYSSPWGWVLRYEDGTVWRWDESKQAWREWSLWLQGPGIAAGSARGKTARRNAPAGQRATAGGPMAFAEKGAVLATNQGLLRCLVSGTCERMKAFGRREKIRAVWTGAEGREILAILDGKLAWSSDGGAAASWSDLPVEGEAILWVDREEADGERFLGTTQGVYFSTEAGQWQKFGGGIPAGEAGGWLRLPNLWVVTERGGGFYISKDKGKSWKRVDEDAERGQFTGLAGTQTGAILAGSESEGLLRLEPGKIHPNE